MSKGSGIGRSLTALLAASTLLALEPGWLHGGGKQPCNRFGAAAADDKVIVGGNLIVAVVSNDS